MFGGAYVPDLLSYSCAFPLEINHNLQEPSFGLANLLTNKQTDDRVTVDLRHVPIYIGLFSPSFPLASKR